METAEKTKKRRVVTIINNLGVGGAERLVVDDSNEFGKREDVEYWLLTLRNEGKNSLSSSLHPEVRWIKFDFSGFSDLSSWIKLCKEIRRIKPDMIFTHLWLSNVIGRISAKICGVDVISFEHNVYDGVKTAKMFWADRRLQGFSKKIIAVSRAVERSLVRHGVKKESIEVLLNGIDLSRYVSASSDGRLKEPEEDFKFLFIGRLIHQKGVDILIKAFSELKKGSLWIVGDGTLRKEMEDLAVTLGVSKRITFFGISNDIPGLLGSADCLVLPSRYEGLGIVVIEAMAAGKPVVISGFEAGLEMITDGKNGLIVEIGSISELKEAMEKIMNDPILGKNLGDEARKNSEGFSIVSHVDKLLLYIE